MRGHKVIGLVQTTVNAFGTGADQMVRVLVMDESRGFIHPLGEDGD